MKNRPQPVYQPHPYSLYELTPNYVSADGQTTHNSYGFRGPEFDVVKKPNAFRIVCMGESTTYCTGIAKDSETYPARLEHHLKLLKPQNEIEVLNAGVGGYTSAENFIRFAFKVQPLKPDLVTYYFTHNDIHPRRFPKLSRDYREYSKSWYEKCGTETFSERMKKSLRQIRHGADVTGAIGDLTRRYAEVRGNMPSINITKNPADYFRDNLKNIALMARGWGIKILFINPPYRFLDKILRGEDSGNYVCQAVHEHRKVIEALGGELGFPVYDLHQDMAYPYDLPKREQESPYYLDSVHVSSKGADMMGELIAKAVQKNVLG